VAPISGQQMRVSLFVTARDFASVPIAIDYKVKGVKGWFPATMASAMDEIPSSPEGVESSVVWDTFADLGAVYVKKARLRATVLTEQGRKKKSKRFEVWTYGDVAGTALAQAVYPDLTADGSLDNLVVIDTRDAASFAGGSVPGARNITSAQIEESGEEALPWPKDTRLAFYCYGGL